MVEENLKQKKQWINLAPGLVRQRVIIEGTSREIVKPDDMRKFLLDLADIADMEVLSGPYAYSAHEAGFGGWIHWKSSGAHIYSYPTNPPLFTVDVYTCKPFEPQRIVEFTKEHFKALDIVCKEIEV